MSDGAGERRVATGWLAASILAAGLVLLLLLLVLTGRGGFAWLGLPAVVILVWIAQQQFAETHRRRYHRWPPGKHFFWTGSPERHELARAWTRRDDDAAVERSRLLGIGLLVLCLVAGLAFVGATL